MIFVTALKHSLEGDGSGNYLVLNKHGETRVISKLRKL
jgi:hypothetical protein